MDRDRAVGLLHGMVEIPSLSGEEGPLAAHLEREMAALGLASQRDAAGNVLGETGAGQRPRVLLLGHLDTVPPALPVRLRGSLLHGRGAVDAKGALAAMICAAADRPSFPGRLVVAGAVEEETAGSRGAMHLVRTLPAPDAVIIGEPSGWRGVVLGYKGQLQLRYRVRCEGTHPAGPGTKAVEQAVAFWQALRDRLGPGGDHASFDRPAATLRALDGDMREAVADIDCRVPPGFDVANFLSHLDGHGGGEVALVGSVPAARVARGSPVARALSAGVRMAGGVPVPKLKTGTSDMNTIAGTWPVPMAAYGPGDSRLDHSDDEHVDLTEYLRAIDVLCHALDELAGNGLDG